MVDSVFITNTELSVDETAGRVFESISRSGTLVGDIVVTYGITSDTATAGEDFIGATGTVTIPAGASQVDVPIQILDDGIGEATEKFAFSVISASGGAVWAPRTSRVSILDNETPAPPPEPEPPLVSNYDITQTPLVSGIDQPIRFIFSPLDASKLYVAEKPGVIALADLATGQVSTVLDLRGAVNESGDRGLLDIALHPDFPNNPYIYAFVVVDPADTAGKTGLDRPDGEGNRYSQLMRYTADAATGYSTIVPGSGVVLLGRAGQSLADISGAGKRDFTDPAYADAPASDRYINPSHSTSVINGFKQDYLKVDSSTHAGGHLSFGPDGKLYVSVGDGGSFDYADPRTPDVQSLDSLSGKILRIDPMTGQGLADNPFVSSGVSLASDRAKIFQLGLRNPFSMTFDPQGRLIIGDTGWNSFEEIDMGGPGANFGWPWFEGADGGESRPAPGYSGFPAATTFYDAVNAGTITLTAPFRAFSHDSADPGFQVQAITAGEAVYTGGVYPASLQNNFIFADFSGGRVYAVNVNDSTDLKYLYSSNGFAPVDFVQGPDGYIYYSDLVAGEIGRLGIASGSTTAPGTITIGNGPDDLVLQISEDAYLGDAQYTVSVDGVQIGGVLTASASHASGADDTVTVLGSWASGNHTFTINFLEDAWGGTPDTDRNLYLDGATINGVAVPGATASLLSAGPQDFAFSAEGGTPPPPPPPGSITIGSGADSLVLKISEDAYLGDAQYTVSVDGVQIGGILTASASHAAGADDSVTVLGNWASGSHTLAINFLEDAYGGTADTDRNLYLDGATINGVAVPGANGSFLSAGPQNFAFSVDGGTSPPPPPPPPGTITIGSGTGSLVLKISEDAYLGDAQYTVSVDGVQIGGVLTASASHASGADDSVTVLGNWASGSHTFSINFIEDAWGGTADTDRNLYLDGAAINGVAVPGATGSFLSAGQQSFTFSVAGGTSPPPPPPPDTTVTIAPDDANPVVQESNVSIVATAGDHVLFIGGTSDIATLTGGTEGVLAFQGQNTITTGAGNDTLRFGGSGNVIDGGGGTNHLEDSGGSNTIVLPGPGKGFDDIFGYVLQNADVFDLRSALSGTAWDGAQGTLGNFLRVTTTGGDATIAMRATSTGSFSNVATLHDSGALDLPGLLAHSKVA